MSSQRGDLLPEGAQLVPHCWDVDLVDYHHYRNGRMVNVTIIVMMMMMMMVNIIIMMIEMMVVVMMVMMMTQKVEMMMKRSHEMAYLESSLIAWG